MWLRLSAGLSDCSYNIHTGVSALAPLPPLLPSLDLPSLILPAKVRDAVAEVVKATLVSHGIDANAAACSDEYLC
jgi:hypothetical protein